MAVGGRYYFAVPDRTAAEALVEALAEFGFAQAGARPRPGRPVAGMPWEVQALDEGPYPDSVIGERQRAVAERQSRAIAQAHGGSMFLVSRFAAGQGRPLQDADMPILRVNPGSRPPVKLIHPVPKPPPGQLSLAPDGPVRTLIRPDDLGLEAIGWGELTDAYGPADDIPALIARLARGQDRWREDLGNVVNRLLHQGTCYQASAPGLVVLSRLAASGALPAAKRRDIYHALLWAAGLYREDLIELAEYTAASGQPPALSRWARDVQDAAESFTPSLLAHWDSEPSASQLILAALAATFPRHGSVVATRIAAMASEFASTQAGVYAHLAHQLVTTDTAGALATADGIATWNRDVRAETIDDESAPRGLRALDILCQAVTAAAGRVRNT
jgi:hypothetical protein